MAEKQLVEAPKQELTEMTASDLENLFVHGDLSKLKPAERLKYYNAYCRAVGVNPVTRPFAYIQMNNPSGGKTLVLYAKKDATEQLRKNHNISLEIVSKEKDADNILTVRVKATMPDGRIDMDEGCVDVKGLAGYTLANAHMKAVTKAKRRATLSICGLGVLDETEIHSIPGAREWHEDSIDGCPKCGSEKWVERKAPNKADGKIYSGYYCPDCKHMGEMRPVEEPKKAIPTKPTPEDDKTEIIYSPPAIPTKPTPEDDKTEIIYSPPAIPPILQGKSPVEELPTAAKVHEASFVKYKCMNCGGEDAKQYPDGSLACITCGVDPRGAKEEIEDEMSHPEMTYINGEILNETGKAYQFEGPWGIEWIPKSNSDKASGKPGLWIKNWLVKKKKEAAQ